MPPRCERHRPFGLPRPITASTAAAKRELSLANSMGQLDAGDRDGGVRERLELNHRRTASLAGSMILLNEVVQVLVRANLDVPPTRVLAPQQPQCAPTRDMSVERDFARHTRSCRDEPLA